MMTKKISEADIINYYSFIWKESNDYFTKFVLPEWEKNTSLYLDTYTFPNKLDWQAQTKEPIVDNLVTRMVNFFVRIVITAQDKYYDIDHKDTNKARAYSDIVNSVFVDQNFPTVFGDCLRYALITSPYVCKVTYSLESEQYPTQDSKTGEFGTSEEITGRTRLVPIDPLNIRLDPTGDNYIIEEQMMDLAEFVELARANSSIDNPWRHVDDVRYSLTPQPAIPVTEWATGQPIQGSSRDVYKPRVCLHHVYTKYLTDSAGNVLDTNVHFIVANRKYLIYYDKNLLPNGMFPYVVGFPMKSIAGRYGRGYITKLRSLILSYLESLNLTLDAFLLSSLGIFEYLVDGVPHGFAHIFSAGLTPGRMYPVKAPNTVRRVYTQDIPQLSLGIVFQLDKIIQNRSFQNEFFMGQPTVKGRPTASEVGIKSQETSGFFTDIASEIERTIIIPTLNLVLLTELIYMQDTYHVDLTGNIKSLDAYNAIKSMSFTDRINEFKQAKITATGISGRIRRAGAFQRYMQLLNIVGNIPQLANAIDWTKVVKNLFDDLDEAPDELINMALLAQTLGNQPIEQGQEQPGVPNVPGVGQPVNPQQLLQTLQGQTPNRLLPSKNMEA
jgi:hypothetical protein